jgi:hypothetical protein
MVTSRQLRQDFAWLFEDRRFTYVNQLMGILGALALFPDWPMPLQFAALLFVVFPVVVLGRASREASHLYQTTREAMTELGESMIRNANSQLIFFSGDMSWVGRYAEALHDAIRQGKEVIIHHDKSEGEVLHRNRQELVNMGCSVHYSSVPLSIRGILVDPQSRLDCVLYIAKRRRRRQDAPQAQGEPGTNESHIYWAAEYSSRSDDVRIDLAYSLHRHVSGQA